MKAGIAELEYLIASADDGKSYEKVSRLLLQENLM